MAFEPIETQEALDKIISERLNRERAKYADYDTLKDSIASLNKEIEGYKTKVTESENKYTQDIAAKDKEIEKYRKSELRVKVAKDTGLPYELADRISGTTEEEMAKDAESLKKFITIRKAPEKNPEIGGKDEAYRKIAAGLFSND